jgi:hypothetical protein
MRSRHALMPTPRRRYGQPAKKQVRKSKKSWLFTTVSPLKSAALAPVKKTARKSRLTKPRQVEGINASAVEERCRLCYSKTRHICLTTDIIRTMLIDKTNVNGLMSHT